MPEETPSKPNYPSCRALTRELTPCEVAAKYSDGMCLFHSSSPEAEDIKTRARSKGGSSIRRRTGTPQELADLLWDRIEAARDDADLSGLASISRAYLAAHAAATATPETDDDQLMADVGSLTPEERATFFKLARRVIKGKPIKAPEPPAVTRAGS